MVSPDKNQPNAQYHIYYTGTGWNILMLYRVQSCILTEKMRAVVCKVETIRRGQARPAPAQLSIKWVEYGMKTAWILTAHLGQARVRAPEQA